MAVKTREMMSLIMNESERLSTLDEFKLLTDRQKHICMTHVQFPELSKGEIAERVVCARSEVYGFFHSKKWEQINNELARQQIRELVQLAVKTLRNCMLVGTTSVRLDAAVRVLLNAELLRSPYGQKINKQDNKMIVLWGNDSIEPSAGGAGAIAVPPVNGNQNPLQPALEAKGDSRISGALQGRGGREAVGKDDAGDKRVNSPSA